MSWLVSDEFDESIEFPETSTCAAWDGSASTYKTRARKADVRKSS